MYNHRSQCHYYKDTMILSHTILLSRSALEVMEIMHCFPGLWFMLIRPCSRVSRDTNRTREQVLLHGEAAPMLIIPASFLLEGMCAWECRNVCDPTVLSQIIFLTGTAASIALPKGISPAIPIPIQVCAGALIQNNLPKTHPGKTQSNTWVSEMIHYKCTLVKPN